MQIVNTKEYSNFIILRMTHPFELFMGKRSMCVANNATQIKRNNTERRNKNTLFTPNDSMILIHSSDTSI